MYNEHNKLVTLYNDRTRCAHVQTYKYVCNLQARLTILDCFQLRNWFYDMCTQLRKSNHPRIKPHLWFLINKTNSLTHKDLSSYDFLPHSSSVYSEFSCRSVLSTSLHFALGLSYRTRLWSGSLRSVYQIHFHLWRLTRRLSIEMVTVDTDLTVG